MADRFTFNSIIDKLLNLIFFLCILTGSTPKDQHTAEVVLLFKKKNRILEMANDIILKKICQKTGQFKLMENA